jgi:hypothetical protein
VRLPRRGAAVALGTAVLAGAAALAVASSSARDPARDARSASFQRSVGGLGLGTALDLGRCGRGFDPRVEVDCAGRREPVPGGGAFCPRHAGSLPPPSRR